MFEKQNHQFRILKNFTFLLLNTMKKYNFKMQMLSKKIDKKIERKLQQKILQKKILNFFTFKKFLIASPIMAFAIFIIWFLNFSWMTPNSQMIAQNPTQQEQTISQKNYTKIAQTRVEKAKALYYKKYAKIRSAKNMLAMK